MKSSSSIAQEPNFVELKSNQIGFCKDDEFSIDQSKLNKVLNEICLKDKGMGSLETFSYKERLHGDFSFYDNCVDQVSINGQTEQTGKISYLVDFSCSLIADNDIKKNDEIINNEIVSDSKVQESNENLASHCSEIYGCYDNDPQEEIVKNNKTLEDQKLFKTTMETCNYYYQNRLLKFLPKSGLWIQIGNFSYESVDLELSRKQNSIIGWSGRYWVCPIEFSEQVKSGSASQYYARQNQSDRIPENNSRINSHNQQSYAGSKLNNASSDGKFANLNPQQRAHCQDKLNRGKIKLDRSSNLYYEMENLPLQGLQKKYVCNNDGSQGLALFNAFVGGAAAIANNQNPSQNYNPSPVPNQPFSLGSPTMEQAIFKLTQAQGYFLEALDEEEHAIAVRQYSMNLNRGTAIGEDDMEKILEKSHEWQTIINKKMKEGFVLDAKAKQTFSQGIPHYASGTALCIAGGFSVASQVSAVTNSSGAAAVIGGIGLAFSAYDSVKALNLFFSSTSDIYAFGKENNVDNIEELEKAKDSLGT